MYIKQPVNTNTGTYMHVVNVEKHTETRVPSDSEQVMESTPWVVLAKWLNKMDIQLELHTQLT